MTGDEFAHLNKAPPTDQSADRDTHQVPEDLADLLHELGEFGTQQVNVGVAPVQGDKGRRQKYHRDEVSP